MNTERKRGSFMKVGRLEIVALARELEGTDVPVAAAHFPGLRFGRLLPGTGPRRWVFS